MVWIAFRQVDVAEGQLELTREQFSEAHRERVEATAALTTATEARDAVEEVVADVDRMRNEVQVDRDAVRKAADAAREARSLAAEASAQLETVVEVTEAARAEIESLREFEQLMIIAARAAYDFDAYLRLQEIVRRRGSFYDVGLGKLREIRRELEFYSYMPGARIVLGLRINEVPVDRLNTRTVFAALFEPTLGKDFRKELMHDLVGRPEDELVDAASELLSNKFLPGLAAATTVLNKKFKRELEFLDVEGWKTFVQLQREGRQVGKTQ